MACCRLAPLVDMPDCCMRDTVVLRPVDFFPDCVNGPSKRRKKQTDIVADFRSKGTQHAFGLGFHLNISLTALIAFAIR